MSVLLIVIIVCAIIFDYINGFHDAANSIATIVSTKVLTPIQAVIWAAFFNFVAFFIFKDHGVANTIAKTVKEDIVNQASALPMVLSGLLAAITWNLFTWWHGIPSSSSHTLIGGFSGAALAFAGLQSINPDPIFKTVIFIVVAPLVGMLMAFLISLWFINAFRKGPLPRIVAAGIVIAVVAAMSTLLVTNTSRLMGIKPEKTESGVGVLAKDVYHGSPANVMGVKKGETILRIDGRAVNTPDQLDEALRSHLNASTISFTTLGSKDNAEHDFAAVYTAKYEHHWVDVVLYGENFKWLLLALIIVTMAIFTGFLNTMNYTSASRWFKRMQLVSSAAFSIGHGGNDAQKVMGIITVALIAGGQIGSFDEMPVWVPLVCYTAISAGTLSGGWKIIKTMGTKITKVTPFEGVAAETAGAITLFVTEQLKIPVSTTHTITGSIIGVGATKRLSAVRWGVTINLLWAWIITIPISALLAAVIYWIVSIF